MLTDVRDEIGTFDPAMEKSNMAKTNAGMQEAVEVVMLTLYHFITRVPIFMRLIFIGVEIVLL